MSHHPTRSFTFRIASLCRMSGRRLTAGFSRAIRTSFESGRKRFLSRVWVPRAMELFTLLTNLK